MAQAISLAKELKDTHALAVALHYAALLGHFERNPAQVERLASDLIELSTRQHFATWLPGGAVLRGWARSASGDTLDGQGTAKCVTLEIFVAPFLPALVAGEQEGRLF